jgi:hypothetical protein
MTSPRYFSVASLRALIPPTVILIFFWYSSCLGGLQGRCSSPRGRPRRVF